MDPDISSKFQPAGPFRCPHATQCPACPFIDLAYSEQLARKGERVRAELGAYPELRALGVAPCAAASKPLGYRTRAKLVASGRALGLFARGSHRVVDIPECRVLDAGVAQTVAAVRARLPAPVPIEGVDVAKVGDEVLLTLIASEDADARSLEGWVDELAAALPLSVHVAFAQREQGAVQLLTSGQRVLRGQRELRHRPAPGVPYHYVTFGAFLQAHAGTARAIHEQLLRGCLEVDDRLPLRVLELYAGSGALALELSARGARVTAVESYAPACERLKRAAEEQRLSLQVEQGDAAERLRALVRAGERFDVVIVNPPRRGLAPSVRELVAELSPARAAYVSCRPASLARDLAHLSRLGFGIERVLPFDMMPLTDQVETLVWLAPGEAAPVEIVQRGSSWIALIKAPHEELAEHDRASATLSARAIQHGAAVERPLYMLERETSGMALFACGGQPLPEVRRRAFHALVKGVVRARGTLQRGRPAAVHYVRERVIAGHSLVRAEAADDRAVLRAFRRLGHPVLGQASADAASAKYFFLRHGLDRAFLHLSELELCTDAGTLTITAPLAPDLLAVLRSMQEPSAGAQTVEEHARHG